MADLLNTNIKKNLVQTQVSTQQNKTAAKTTTTQQTSAAQSTTKMTSSQVQSGIVDGTLSTAKAVSTLKSDLNAKVVTTKTANNKTVAQTNVGGKAITINTNAKDVPITTSGSTITTAKTLAATKNGSTKSTVNASNINKTFNSKNNTENSILGSLDSVYNTYKNFLGGISKQEFKSLYNLMDAFINNKPINSNDVLKALTVMAKIDVNALSDMLGIQTQDSSSTKRNAPARKPASNNKETTGDKSWEDYYYDFCNSWKSATGNDNISGQYFRADGTPIPMTNQGGVNCNSASQAQTLGFLGIMYATGCCIKDGLQKGAAWVNKTVDQLANNVLDKFKIYDYSQGNTNNTNNSDSTGKTNRGGGGVINNRGGNGQTLYDKGFTQYGGFTVNTGNGSSVEFGPLTATGIVNDDGTVNTIYTRSDGTAVVGGTSGANTTTDGIGGVNNHKPGDTWTDANGTECTLGQDGSLTCKYKDGTVVVYNADGSEVTIRPNGDVTVTPPTDGSGNSGGTGSGGASGTNSGGSSDGQQSNPLLNTLTGLADWANAGGNSSLGSALADYIAGGCQGNFTWTSSGSSGNGVTGGNGGGGTNGTNGSNGSNGWTSTGVTSSSDQWNSWAFGTPQGGSSNGGALNNNGGAPSGGGGYNNPYDPYGGSSFQGGYSYGGKWITTDGSGHRIGS